MDKRRWSSSQKTTKANDLALPRFRTGPTLRASTKPTSTNSQPANRPKDAALAPPSSKRASNGRASRATVFSRSVPVRPMGALGFYHHLGFRDEDVKLVKLLTESGSDNPNRQT